ncbi:MAG: hypothetical protein N2439_15615 [Anaerolineae bacterium]|nr:hypothetical protein [Anaerolineae bacterium]
MRFLRTVAFSLGALLIVLAAGCAPAGPPMTTRPRLSADASVADDLRALAQETWEQFLVAFAGRTACFGDVILVASFDLADRAAYEPRTAVVTVRVPATAAMLQSALIHEWAHHVEHQCVAHGELRSAFLAAQGLPAETPWRPAAAETAQEDGAAWAATPSEQYAEAAVEVVLGHRPIPTAARVSPAAVAVLRAWAAGR